MLCTSSGRGRVTVSSTIKIIDAAHVPSPSYRFVANGGSPDRNVFEKEFDPAEEDPSTILIDTIAYIHNADPVTLDPLAETVDTDALDALLTARSAPDERPIEVTFSYEGLFICIRSDGSLWIRWNT